MEVSTDSICGARACYENPDLLEFADDFKNMWLARRLYILVSMLTPLH